MLELKTGVKMNKLIVFAHLAGILIFTSCDDKTPKIDQVIDNFKIDSFDKSLDRKTLGNNSFGEIMEKNKIGYPKSIL